MFKIVTTSLFSLSVICLESVVENIEIFVLDPSYNNCCGLALSFLEHCSIHTLSEGINAFIYLQGTFVPSYIIRFSWNFNCICFAFVCLFVA